MCKILINFLFLIISVFGAISLQKYKHNRTARISGGIIVDDANSGGFAFMVSISFGLEHLCGGTIISRLFILTAAHCVYRRPKELLVVRAGTLYLKKEGFICKIENVIIHPEYDPESYSYNAAILSSKRRMNYVDGVSHAKLTNHRGEPHAPLDGYVAGWGHNSSSNKEFSEVLHYTYLVTISEDHCKRYFRDHLDKRKASFCARYKLRNTCYGDDGGPFISEGKIFGIVSSGYTKCIPGYPTIFTYVPDIRKFIENVTQF